MWPRILANVITADMGLIPGMALVGPAFGLPLSLLAGFIERPFYSAAGIKRHCIWYSLQANFISLLVGYGLAIVMFLLATATSELIFAIWPFAAVAISIWVEREYLKVRSGVRDVAFGPLFAANVVSAGACVALFIVVNALRSMLPEVARVLAPMNAKLQVLAGVLSLLIFAASFVVPRRVAAAADPGAEVATSTT